MTELRQAKCMVCQYEVHVCPLLSRTLAFCECCERANEREKDVY